MKQLLALPAMQDWYKAALAETWRWPSSDDDARNAGKITADFRVTA